MPPGSAKSTYISKLFPAWALRRPNRNILACSYAKDLIQGFGRYSRNLAEANSRFLGYRLKQDSKAADEWETSNGGRYFCAGVNAGIAGHRADIAFIDDPIGTAEDARSENYRDKLWSWYWDDFSPRLKNEQSSVIIVANRRHVDDLVGRLLERDAGRWELIKMPLIVETDEQEKADPLGRKKGEILWPGYFGPTKLLEARKSDNYHGLHQQEPTPPGGDLIKADWLVPYESINDLPDNLRVYVGSDHALTTREENDANCLIPAGLDEKDNLWILPDIWWKRDTTDKLVEAMIDLGERRSPIEWFAEDEHIRKAIGPFLNKRMSERGVYFPIKPLPSNRDLQSRSSSIRGRMGNYKVRFPVFAHWWQNAKQELLEFPNGKHDDFLAALSEIGRGLSSMTKPSAPREDEPEDFLGKPVCIKIKDIKESDARFRRALLPRYGDR